MQIYSKSMKNATSPLFRNHNRSALPAGTYITHRVIYYPIVEIYYILRHLPSKNNSSKEEESHLV